MLLNPKHVNWNELSRSAFLAQETLNAENGVPEDVRADAQAAAYEVWKVIEAVAAYVEGE
jgi:hypothetical protein